MKINITTYSKKAWAVAGVMLAGAWPACYFLLVDYARVGRAQNLFIVAVAYTLLWIVFDYYVGKHQKTVRGY